MAWTTPRTWAVNEQLTAAKMNEQVRDNEQYIYDTLAYLYDTKQGKMEIYQWTNESGANHSGDTTPTALGSGKEITLSVKSTVIVLCSFNLASTGYDSGYKPSAAQLYRGTTALGVSVVTYSERASQNDVGCLVAVDAAVAAGTYTYYLKYWPTNAAYTAYCDQATMVLIVIPD